MTAKHFELPEILEFHEVKDAFTRTVMILMAITTLAGGVVEFLHSRAAVAGERTRNEAQQLGIQAMAELVRADHTAQAEYENFALAAEEQTRRWNSLQQKYLPIINRLPTNTRPADLEIARLRGLAAQTGRLSQITPEGPYGPSADPTFPQRFFASKQVAYWQVWARQDAVNEEFVALKKQQSHYTTVLTLYAAALYLFGLALAIPLPVRRRLAGIAGVLVILGTAGAAWAWLHGPAQMSKDALDQYTRAYASGKEALAVAHDAAGYERAKQFFTQAIGLRSSFAQAYQDRAAAAFEIGAPQHLGLPGVTNVSSLEAAERDEQEALRFGLRNSDLLLSHGSHLFLLALEGGPTQSRARLRQSMAEIQQAVELDLDYPLARYRLAAAQLAAQAFPQARKTFADAVMRTLATEGREYRFPRERQQQFVSAALTDLEAIVTSRAAMAEPRAAREALVCEAQSMKTFVVGSVSMRQTQPLPAPGACAPAGGTYDPHAVVLPVGVAWWTRLGRVDPRHDVFAFQWYYQDPGLQKWMAVPNVSVLSTSQVGAMPTRPGLFYDETPFLTTTTPPACVPRGTFRVELYLNGRYVGAASRATPATYAGMTAVMRRDLNAAFCVPRSWKAQRPGAGFMAEYRSPDRAEGVLFMRFQFPRPAMDSAVAKERVVTRYVTLLLERVLEFPQGRYESVPVPKGFPTLNFAFVKRAAYRAGDREAVVQSGVATDGGIVIGVVHGPRAYVEHNREAGDIYASIVIFGTHGPEYYGLNGAEGGVEWVQRLTPSGN